MEASALAQQVEEIARSIAVLVTGVTSAPKSTRQRSDCQGPRNHRVCRPVDNLDNRRALRLSALLPYIRKGSA